MATSSSSQLEDITCCLCFEHFNHTDKAPKFQPCVHTFCQACLEQLVQTNIGLKLRCPICRTEFTVPKDGAKSLPSNLAVKQLLDNLPQVTAPVVLDRGKEV